MLDPSALKQEIAQEITAAQQEEYPELEPAPDPEAMLAQLYSADVMACIQAARAFCEIIDSRAIPKLLEFLQADCPLLRVSAAYALGKNQSPSAIPVLLQQLEQDWNDYVRKGIVWALGTSGDGRVFPVLSKTLVQDTPAVRLWTASALGQLGDVRAVPLLVEKLQHDPIGAVRGNCAWALGKLLLQLDPSHELYQQAVSALSAALKDEDVGVQTDAKEALAQLGMFWEEQG
ncbi:MAG: HEAT repeat domain-containing protein [Pseudanabaenaceae cyanobacterium]